MAMTVITGELRAMVLRLRTLKAKQAERPCQVRAIAIQTLSALVNRGVVEEKKRQARLDTAR